MNNCCTMTCKPAGYTSLFGFFLCQLLQETLCIVCKTTPAEGSLLRFSLKQCSFSCCGEVNHQYCCVVSKTVIIGCATGGAFVVIIGIGVVCYCLHRSRGKRYERYVRRIPRSVSAVSVTDVYSMATDNSYTGDTIGQLVKNLEVRRFSQLSEVSLPSRVYHIPVKYKSKPVHNPVSILAKATVPVAYKQRGTSDNDNEGFRHV